MGIFHCLSCERVYQVRCMCMAFSEVPKCVHCASDEECQKTAAQLERESRIAPCENVTHEHHYRCFYGTPRDQLVALSASDRENVLANVSWQHCPYCNTEQTRSKYVIQGDENELERPHGVYYKSCAACNSFLRLAPRATVFQKLELLKHDTNPHRLFLCALCNAVFEARDKMFASRTHSLELKCENEHIRVFLLNIRCPHCPTMPIRDDADFRVPTITTQPNGIQSQITVVLAWVIVMLLVYRFFVMPLLG